MRWFSGLLVNASQTFYTQINNGKSYHQTALHGQKYKHPHPVLCREVLPMGAESPGVGGGVVLCPLLLFVQPIVYSISQM